jgi:hypothetical protein
LNPNKTLPKNFGMTSYSPTKLNRNTLLRAGVEARGLSDKHCLQLYVSFVLQMERTHADKIS